MKVLYSMCWVLFCAKSILSIYVQNHSLLYENHPILPLNLSEVNRIAFGSCNKEDRKQPLWSIILAKKPQLWVWMGDNIYGDYKELGELQTYLPPFPVFRNGPPEMLFSKYRVQLDHPGYQKLLQRMPVIGTWDDHDYGKNDGNSKYPYRNESKRLFFDFIGEPIDSSRRNRTGVYSSHVFGSGRRKVKFILLDVRFNKDPYATENGSFLGDAQWKWLNSELRTSDAAFNFIISGVQVLPTDRFFGGECWDRFPQERKRLLSSIIKSRARGVILLSGDVHFAEINSVKCSNFGNLVEITSSGLTHSWLHFPVPLFFPKYLFRMANYVLAWEFRPNLEDYFGGLNAGFLDFDWDTKPNPIVKISILGEDGDIKLSKSITSERKQRPSGSFECDAIQNISPLLTGDPFWVVLIY